MIAFEFYPTSQDELAWRMIFHDIWWSIIWWSSICLKGFIEYSAYVDDWLLMLIFWWFYDVLMDWLYAYFECDIGFYAYILWCLMWWEWFVLEFCSLRIITYWWYFYWVLTFDFGWFLMFGPTRLWFICSRVQWFIFILWPADAMLFCIMCLGALPPSTNLDLLSFSWMDAFNGGFINIVKYLFGYCQMEDMLYGWLRMILSFMLITLL